MGPVDSLDHASRLPNYGSKMGIDATRKWPGEGFTRPWPGVIEIPADVKLGAWMSYGSARGSKLSGCNRVLGRDIRVFTYVSEAIAS